jgi:hypothetical protein
MSDLTGKCEQKDCNNIASRIIAGGGNISKLCKQCYDKVRI